MCVLTVTPSYIMETVLGTHLEKWGGGGAEGNMGKWEIHLILGQTT